jgi:hypothetical protein
MVETVFEITKGTPRPEGILQLLARHDITGALDQYQQDLQRLFLKVDPLVFGP